jgi:hypothetical protein
MFVVGYATAWLAVLDAGDPSTSSISPSRRIDELAHRRRDALRRREILRQRMELPEFIEEEPDEHLEASLEVMYRAQLRGARRRT